MTMPLVDSDPNFAHKSVMLQESIELLAPVDGGTYVDLTAGAGGHSRALLEAAPGARVIALDRDEQAILATSRLFASYGPRAQVVKSSFGEVEGVLAQLGVHRVDGLLADLGLSSPQLDNLERGMSFRGEGPLDMRMDRSQGETALELIQRVSQDELANIIFQFGEERRSRRVARCIKQAFESGELENTSQLRRAIVRAVGPRRVGGVDPATRTFQALRISVNDELGEISRALSAAGRLVKPDGMAVFISFHSLEDRLVKRAFIARDIWQRIFKKPQTPGEQELSENPRARSAKLRAARRLPDSGWLAEPLEEFDGE
jgi:16S rRNA (cytosine1402-N4)-methyltransferase